MNEQINLRLPPKLLSDARREAARRGHRNVQGLIEQALRDEIYDNIVLTPSGKRKLAQAARDIKEGSLVSGDIILERMRKKAKQQR